MIPTLVLAAAMSFGPAQGGLELTNARITFAGEFGPARPDNRFLPGDTLFLAFDIEGLRPNAQGKVEYFMGMIVTDSTGKTLFESNPVEQNMTLPLGAAKLPARAYVDLGLDLKGPCKCKVEVEDKATKVKKTIEKNFEVVSPAFGIVQFQTSYDSDGKVPAPLLGVQGQSLFLQFVTVGFNRDPTSKQPNNQVEMRVYDAAGKATTEQPLAFVVNKGVGEEVNGIDWTLPLPLNRPGNFTVELKAEDKLSKQSYKVTFTVTVFQSVK